jgi:hypothetical protein
MELAATILGGAAVVLVAFLLVKAGSGCGG